jgi:hypothetical protein
MYFPTGHVPTGSSSRLLLQNENNEMTYMNNPSSAFISQFNKNTTYYSPKFCIANITGNGPVYSVFIQSVSGDDAGTPTPFSANNATVIDDFFEINRPMFAVSNAATHGDSMRGKYALVFLSTTETAKTQPFELYAVNVDYAQSKMDSSLG